MSAIMPHRLVVLGGMGPGGTYRFADGTAAAPSISFLSDPNTGFYRVTTGVIGTSSVGNNGVHFFTSGTSGRIGHLGSQYIEWTLSGALNLVAAGTNQNITLTPSGTGIVELAKYTRVTGGSSDTLSFGITGNGSTDILSFGNSSGLRIQGYASNLSTARNINIQAAGGNLLLGTTTDSANGRLQLATHSTPAGGIGFGADFTISRADVNHLRLWGSVSGNTAVDILNGAGTYGRLQVSNGTGHFTVAAIGTGGNLIFTTNAGVTALTLDSSQVAQFASHIYAGAAGVVGQLNRWFIAGPSDGVMRLTNWAGSDFGRLQFGGTTSAFPSIKRNGTAFDFRLADDSNFCAINVSGVVFSSLGSITFPADGIALIRNNAGTDFARLQFGGTTSSFPALTRSGSSLRCSFADASGLTAFWASQIVANGAATNNGAGTVSYGGTTATTVGASGAASALPANPLGYIIVNVAGTTAKIPYYNN